MFNTDLLEAVELGFLLDIAETVVVGAAEPRRVARRALPRGLPGPRRQELHAAHRWPTGARCPSRATACGARTATATARARSRHTTLFEDYQLVLGSKPVT